MTIAIDARMIRSSGIGRYLSLVLDALKARNPGPCILLGKPGELDTWLGGGWTLREFSAGIYDPRQHFGYPLFRCEADVFFCPHITMPFFTLPGKRNVLTIHDCFHLQPDSGLNVFERMYMSMYYRNASNKADVLIAVSDFTKTEILKYCGASRSNKIQVIPNGIDHAFLEQKSGVEGSGKNGHTCLFVGNMKPHKNLANLAKAFALPILADKDLVVVGRKEGFIKGLDRDTLLLLERPNISFTGFVDDVQLREWYTKADMLVLPSFYEGFGLPPAEALACGTPVVLSDIPVFREIYGQIACFVDPHDPSSIAMGIRRVFEDPAIRQAQLSRAADFVKGLSSMESATRTVDVLLTPLVNTASDKVSQHE